MLAQPGETVDKPRPQVPWRLQDVGLTVAWVLAVLLHTSIVLGVVIVVGDFGEDAELAGLFGVMLAVEAAMLAATAWFTVGRYGCGWRALGFRPTRSGGWVVALAVAGAALFAFYVTLGIYFSIVELAGADALKPESAVPEESFDNVLVLSLAFIVVSVAAPLAEETFFRGFLFPALRSRWGTLWAALASALLFAAVHFDPGLIVPFTVIGLLLVWAYVVTGSLWTAIFAHFGFNTISLVVGVTVGGGS